MMAAADRAGWRGPATASTGDDDSMRNRHSLLLLLLVGAFAAPAAAQQPALTQRQVDSLAAQMRVLKARLDSVLGVLARLQAQPAARAPARDTTAGDELVALRAAATSAAGGAAQRSDTGTPTEFVGRERNQAQLNPEISVTGDVRAYGTMPGVQRDTFDPREFEIGFQSALDPYSTTKIFVSLEGGQVSVEEGYAYWTGLPGRIRLDVGKFRQQFGELNRWHLHAVPETEYPLALTRYLGDDGLSGTGLSLYRAFGGLGVHELTAQLTRTTYMQLGGTALYGTNPDSALRTRVGGVDFRITWRPPARALYREWTLRGELFALKKEVAGVGPTRLGGYVSTTYKLGQRWIAGVRYDYVEDPTTGMITRQVIPSMTLWESEWVFLRAQYQWQKVASATTTH